MTNKKEKYQPSIKRVISYRHPIDCKITPDGKKVAYITMNANWEKNTFDQNLFILDAKTKKVVQEIKDGKSLGCEWFDNNSLIIHQKKENQTTPIQLWYFDLNENKFLQITSSKVDILSFKCTPNGIVYLSSNPRKTAKIEKRNKYGNFIHFEKEQSTDALFYLDFKKTLEYLKNKQKEKLPNTLVSPCFEITSLLHKPLKITDYFIGPGECYVYINCQKNMELVHINETSSYILKIDLQKALSRYIKNEILLQKNKETRVKIKEKLRANLLPHVEYFKRFGFPKGAKIVALSPKGNKVLISYSERGNFSYSQDDLWLLDLHVADDVLGDKKVLDYFKKITGDFDKKPKVVNWLTQGIIVGYIENTKGKIAKITPEGEIQTLSLDGLLSSHLIYDFTSRNKLLMIASTSEKTFELFLIDNFLEKKSEILQLTQFSKETKNWSLGKVEKISWLSKDGEKIYGVLRKPENYNKSKKYPLVFIVHSGPNWYSPEELLEPVDLYYYPTIQFINNDILVLKPNYRGSVGRGQAFLELNKDNLGIGDLWDIESAIESLDKKGIINTEKLGIMGWSQGGYIAAFTSIQSNYFKAASVGAGTVNWYTYHISSEKPQFTNQYLGSSPFIRNQKYLETSPINMIKNAKTPTLIQHGERDQRVPLINAKELYRGLKEMKVPVEFFIFQEMGHTITKPRESLLIKTQNLQWFMHHLLGKELDLTPINKR
ncbi:MAG: prolyl oligopeptidase family serine peptidase [Asgard group archaeon]|nr:prolyl oligopeptidase family serine peptidase [Asgard group archaeon]